MKTCVKQLADFLKGAPKELNVVVLPDFFLDRLVSLNLSPSDFADVVKNIAERKGGSIDGIRQTDIRGGNAVNVASALAALGANVVPIVCTSKLGLQLLRYNLGPLGIDLSHVKVVDSASTTTALELNSIDGRTNVMIRDLGSLADFGQLDLTDDDYEAMRMADFVCVFNWAGTRKHGTELAQNIFYSAKTNGDIKTYFDSADPNPNREQIPELIEKVLKAKQLDVLSLNENEAVTYAGYIQKKTHPKKENLMLDELALQAARFLAKKLPARIDLHTTEFSATFTNRGETIVPTFKVNVLRATGAGDAWDAGNIFADGNSLPDDCRLALANAVSACYLTNPDGSHPTRQQVTHFLETRKA